VQSRYLRREPENGVGSHFPGDVTVENDSRRHFHSGGTGVSDAKDSTAAASFHSYVVSGFSRIRDLRPLNGKVRLKADATYEGKLP
jgi:hypothetical protein